MFTLMVFYTQTHLIIILIFVSIFQEPGTEEEIKKFAEGYGVKFDMFSKVKVNGSDAHPLWNFLKSKQGGTLGNFIKWNFTKFLVDRNGKPVSRYSPQTNPIVSLQGCFALKDNSLDGSWCVWFLVWFLRLASFSD